MTRITTGGSGERGEKREKLKVVKTIYCSKKVDRVAKKKV